MSASLPVALPDIGDFKDVPVVEILVKPGDRIAVDDLLISIESDKATMRCPRRWREWSPRSWSRPAPGCRRACRS